MAESRVMPTEGGGASTLKDLRIRQARQECKAVARDLEGQSAPTGYYYLTGDRGEMVKRIIAAFREVCDERDRIRKILAD